MRRSGVTEFQIQDLLTFHTPTQIEMGFRKMPDADPKLVADLILRGRFGFRAGIKQNRQPPDYRPQLLARKKQQQEERTCPPVTQEVRRGLLEQFLQGLEVPE